MLRESFSLVQYGPRFPSLDEEVARSPVRKFLSTDARMISIVDFGGFQPFEDAEMIRPATGL